ncbi:hypothetical protein M885DRAFT_590859 [Pelagophyceae sp. CCMP2097]|nr:hypothetical protein M885DRAFT_590859 [Pelagophyceae sp. CCMP2097]|mmetsp:Transcript_2362/g.8343  ORF Transcript_2362/g.8343 Transcript_2362/m.8343 type:complete len:148 (+) Transcript_2362:12-455(+)
MCSASLDRRCGTAPDSLCEFLLPEVLENMLGVRAIDFDERRPLYLSRLLELFYEGTFGHDNGAGASAARLQVRNLFEHARDCHATTCAFAGCCVARPLMLHYKQCRTPVCGICDTLRSKICRFRSAEQQRFRSAAQRLVAAGPATAR